jgi:hypothetical protein
MRRTLENREITFDGTPGGALVGDLGRRLNREM